MNCAKNIASYSEATEYVGRESNIVAFSRRQACYSTNPLVEEVSYCETVRLTIIVYDMDNDVLVERDIHDRPGIRGRDAVCLTAIVTNVLALVGHDNGEDSRVRTATWTSPAVWAPEEVKRVGSSKEPGHADDNYDRGEHAT